MDRTNAKPRVGGNMNLSGCRHRCGRHHCNPGRFWSLRVTHSLSNVGTLLKRVRNKSVSILNIFDVMEYVRRGKRERLIPFWSCVQGVLAPLWPSKISITYLTFSIAKSTCMYLEYQQWRNPSFGWDCYWCLNSGDFDARRYRIGIVTQCLFANNVK